MWPYMKFMVAFDSWILSHYLHLVNFSFSYWMLTRLKNILQWNCFFFYRALIFAQKHQFSDIFVCRPHWLTISDSQSGMTFMIGCSGNLRSGTLPRIVEMSQLTIKCNTWYIHELLKVVGNNIRTSSNLILLLLSIFDISIIIILCNYSSRFWQCQCFLNSYFQVTRLSSAIFFSVSDSKLILISKFFIENQLPAKSNQIHGSVKVRWIKC